MKLITKNIKTPVGYLRALGTDKALFFLDFSERKGLEQKIGRYLNQHGFEATIGEAAAITSIEKELELYFQGKIKSFQTQLHTFGTPFQRVVWNSLLKIPFGETRSYAEIAIEIGKPNAYRAVALANSANCFAIVIPCHRVINACGGLGGYSSGVARKSWLLKLERKYQDVQNTCLYEPLTCAT